MKKEITFVLVALLIAVGAFFAATAHAAEKPHVSNKGMIERNVIASTGLTDRQVRVLRLAKKIGNQYKLNNSLVGIVMQESLAGTAPKVGDTSLPFGKRSYGVAQVKLATAKQMMKQYPKEFGKIATDEEIIARLIMDDEWNLRVASKNLVWLQSRGMNLKKSITAYNRGIGGVNKVKDPENFHYTKAVFRHMNDKNIRLAINY